METELLYTVPEVAKLLKCNPDYVRKLRKAGLLRFIKLGSYKVRGKEIERFLAEMEGKDVSDPFHVKDLAEPEQEKIPEYREIPRFSAI